MRLGQYFTLEELTTTNTGIYNQPYDDSLVNLTRLVCLVLDPLREEVGPLRITSGYRSEAVNKAVGGSKISYHMRGLAADIQHVNSDKISANELFEIMCITCNGWFDKCILEFGRWVHIQIKPAGETNRNQFLIAEKVDGKTQYREYRP